jgi:hypothetical protein
MDKRTTGIILTIIAVLLCGLPGLAILCFGTLFAAIGSIPGATTDVFGSNDPEAAMGFGLGGVCLGLLLILIPVVVGVLTLRRRPAPPASYVPPVQPAPPPAGISMDEPLPPPAPPASTAPPSAEPGPDEPLPPPS